MKVFLSVFLLVLFPFRRRAPPATWHPVSEYDLGHFNAITDVAG